MLDIKVPDQYPLVPPIVYYRTKIFHPNVHFKVGSQEEARFEDGLNVLRLCSSTLALRV